MWETGWYKCHRDAWAPQSLLSALWRPPAFPAAYSLVPDPRRYSLTPYHSWSSWISRSISYQLTWDSPDTTNPPQIFFCVLKYAIFKASFKHHLLKEALPLRSFPAERLHSLLQAHSLLQSLFLTSWALSQVTAASFILSQGETPVDWFTLELMETSKRIRSFRSESCGLEIQCSYDKGSEFQTGEFWNWFGNNLIL